MEILVAVLLGVGVSRSSPLLIMASKNKPGRGLLTTTPVPS